MRRVLVHPLFWLTLQIALTTVFLSAAGRLEPQRVPDTKSYEIAADLETLSARLGYYRSIGYPIFLNTVRSLGFTHQAIPTIQLGTYFLSVYLFWFALWRYSGSRWLAFAATFPLSWAAVMELASRIQPDFLSAAATVFAIAFVFLLTTKPRHLGLWIGVIVSVVAAYHLRPAAVFLVGFVPLIGAILCWIWNQRSLKRTAQVVGLLTLAMLIPYWSFCALRLATVGHFGLVSFGGTNLAGLAANFISGRVVRELPQEHRDLARRMLKLRRKKGWTPMTKKSHAEDFFVQYSDNIWDVANPAGKFELAARKRTLKKTGREESSRDWSMAAWQRQPSRVARNTIVGTMSKAVIGTRLDLYLRWVRAAQLYGLRQLTDYVWIVGPFLLVLISLPILLVRRQKGGVDDGRHGADSGRPGSPTMQETLVVLSLLGVGFFSGYLLLVSLVSFPFTRYFQSMILFVPTMLCAQVFVIWRRIAGSISR